MQLNNKYHVYWECKRCGTYHFNKKPQMCKNLGCASRSFTTHKELEERN